MKKIKMKLTQMELEKFVDDLKGDKYKDRPFVVTDKEQLAGLMIPIQSKRQTLKDIIQFIKIGDEVLCFYDNNDIVEEYLVEEVFGDLTPLQISKSNLLSYTIPLGQYSFMNTRYNKRILSYLFDSIRAYDEKKRSPYPLHGKVESETTNVGLKEIRYKNSLVYLGVLDSHNLHIQDCCSYLKQKKNLKVFTNGDLTTLSILSYTSDNKIDVILMNNISPEHSQVIYYQLDNKIYADTIIEPPVQYSKIVPFNVDNIIELEEIKLC